MVAEVGCVGSWALLVGTLVPSAGHHDGSLTHPDSMSSDSGNIKHNYLIPALNINVLACTDIIYIIPEIILK